MCGRFTIQTPENIKQRFQTTNSPSFFKPSYNISPSQFIPAVTRFSPNSVTIMKWGFIFSKNSQKSSINIRKESLQDKPFFTRFLVEKRCIIPAEGFYEWGNLNLEGKPEKYPFYFYLKDNSMFGFAGIYNEFTDGEGKKHYFAALITTNPNKLVEKVHHRMPVILDKKSENKWLEKDNKNARYLLAFCNPFPEQNMRFHVVSKRVNSPANDDGKLIEPVNINDLIPLKLI